MEIDQTASDDVPYLFLKNDPEDTCNEFEQLGYSSACLHSKVRHHAETFLERLPSSATAEEHMKAIMAKGINLSSLF